jgi:hypothetical protein
VHLSAAVVKELIAIASNVPTIMPDIAKLSVQGSLITGQIGCIALRLPLATATDVLIKTGAVASDICAHSSNPIIVVVKIPIVMAEIRTLIVGPPVLCHRRGAQKHRSQRQSQKS